MAVSGMLAMIVPSSEAAGAAAAYLNPALVQVGQVPGQIIDVSQTQILYFDGDVSPAELAVQDRATGQSVTVPTVPGLHVVDGWLFPGGVVFRVQGADVTTARLYEWDGGPDVTELGPLNAAESPLVRGSYAIWSDGSGLYERDLAAQQTAVVSSNAGNWNNDVTPAGEVVYWAYGADYLIMSYLNGQTGQVSPDTPGMWNVYPVTDGTNVVYKQAKPGSAPPFTIVLNHGGTETHLTAPSDFDPVPGWDYSVAGGWTAFQQPDSTGTIHTWLRAPDGTTTQLPDITAPGRQAIDAMNGAGQVMYSSGQSLYLGQAGQPAILLAAGNGTWINRRVNSAANFATYLGQQWVLAIGGTLYALSSQPLVTLTVTVHGHGTVSISPYGTGCRATCQAQFAPGAELNLTATADLPGWRFTRWEGACSGTSVTCQLRLDAATAVTALFHPADTTAPTTTAPATRPQPGAQLSAGIPPAIPLTTSWTATDPDDPVAQQELQVSVNGGGYAPVSLPSADASQGTPTVVPTAQYEFRARGTDSHGNVGDWAYGRSFTVDTAQETAATFTGAWREHQSPGAWGGTVASTTSATAAATITANGQEFAIVGPTGPHDGSLQILVDGAPCQTVSAYSRNRSPRIILAAISLTPGNHTVRITQAPGSHGRIELDGFIALR